MKKFWSIFYNILIIPSIYVTVRFAGLFKAKFRRGLKGRKRIFEDLIINAASLDKSKKIIWFHSSSLGEFEQAKPIIEELKAKDNFNILVTFFSPSGYENSKKYPYADLISYIPFDTVFNARTFISIVKPALAVIMRYDIWPNHVKALRDVDIPVFLVDATMKVKSPRKLPFVKQFHENLFQSINKILTVSETDVKGFKEFGCSDEQLNIVGDTRFDRVYFRSLKAKESKLIKEELLNNRKIFIAGSSWESDEEILIPVFKRLSEKDNNIIFIIAPHEPTLIHIENIESELKSLGTIRFSHLNNYKNEKVIIVDSIGILLTLYSYADVAFVGGGFKYNVHNVLEAAVYGIPVLFGPKYENSQEAKTLIERGGGIVVKNKRAAYKILRMLFYNEKLRKLKGEISLNYVQENLGATDKIIKEIYKVI